ncbi:PREDICTED: Golgi-specific brefeldin A-resistance guanine nucleotide exchange factor 1 isoform X1 [Rhagoletis zephyria]|uniref:Golgi-specific brefeldin A-resistance guanine nucleotide exchange factor 1 isoform X1 n=1 Tax=Rhagoletis zephyria TaxID=28612 RepID=UPI00081157C1|nr:PREDICTED: Golgi-specific brefeldin A-resistance guanine nucleotide exchange factor 1 isoform X1 [Rhagoletis zephyria]
MLRLKPWPTRKILYKPKVKSYKMTLPGNGIFVVREQMSTLMTAMRRGSRWNSSAYVDEEKDGLMKLFINLKEILKSVEDLRLIEPNVFLAPFLEVIRTDETTGAVTSLALEAINEFLSSGLIDPTSTNLALTVENIVDAVTHARFMGTDQSSDGVTLFCVVEVLHTLMRSPEGSVLSNEAVCEVMLSCFKICFEPRLNELLRRYAKKALKDMVWLLFMRLPQFSEDRNAANVLRKFQMLASAMDQNKNKQRKKPVKATHAPPPKTGVDAAKSELERKLSAAGPVDPPTPHLQVLHPKAPPLATTPATPAGNILDMQGKITQTPTTTQGAADTEGSTEPTICAEQCGENADGTLVDAQAQPLTATGQQAVEATDSEEQALQANGGGSSEYINSVGVRFTQQNSLDGSEGAASLQPYGLPCIQELFRFLILLCNPLDKQNTDTMIHMGLSLLTMAFKVGADNIGKYDTLLELVKDDLCRNLFALMNSERLTIFAADLQLCFLLFESLRGHLKFQMEAYLKKLSEIIASDSPKTPYEMRELALDNLLQLWRIPGFVSELYINYDCDLYCTDLFEGLVNLLSKYTLSATNAVYSTHIISLDTLTSVIENIEQNCIASKNINNEDDGNSGVGMTSTSRHSRHNSELEGIIIDGNNDDNKSVVENISKFINSSSRLRIGAGGVANVGLTREYLANVKEKKRVLSQGTELFNQRPDKGIQYLQEHGILSAQLDPMEVALFLRENPGLDKKMIGEYISKKKNVDSKILMNFVDSFDFAGLRVDQALRLYLETFRLPGEAPLIFLVLEHFADHWHKQNNEPFANTDAAFSLAYAIIMLNMDQHNSNAKRLNVPMTQEDFLKNLRGLNGGVDFDQEMLSNVFNAIKNEEIVMPAEQTGLVRENYLWKVLLRRGVGPDGVFKYVQDSAYDLEVFNLLWGASLSALSFMFDKSSEQSHQRILCGFTKCAAIAAHYNLHANFDALILTLCKFTTLSNLSQPEAPTVSNNEITQSVNFGFNAKAQAAMRTVFALVHDYGDCLREGWKHILELFLQLFRLKLLPKSLIEVEDFCEESGKTQLKLVKPSQKQEAGLFSSLYSYLSSEGQREPTYEEQEFIKMGKKCIKECQLDQMIQESRFVQLDSLQELLKNILALVKPPTSHKFEEGAQYSEDVVVFWMELLVKIVIQNRDRMVHLWPDVRDRIYLLLIGATTYDYEYLLNRSIVAVLKLAIYLMRNEELCPIVLQSLKMLLTLKAPVILRISRQISTGVYELLKTSAQNIHSEQDWQIIFTILECVGAGAVPPEIVDTFLPQLPLELIGVAHSDGTMSSEEDSGLPDRGYNSDTEASVKSQLQSQQHKQQEQTNMHMSSPYPSSPTAENWILVNKDSDLSTQSRPQSPPIAGSLPAPVSMLSLSPLFYNCKLGEHSPIALFKCWDSLAFIVRNVAHITPYNFESCVRCIRTFVECCRDGGIAQRRRFEAELTSKSNTAAANAAAQRRKAVGKRGERDALRKANTGGDHYVQDQRGGDPKEEDLRQRYETLSIQLIDLMYTLYTRTAQIFRWWAEEECAVPQCSALWAQGWCPLLQGIARLAMDRRREVRTYAISCLQQRALLVHDLQTLSGAEWTSCFQQVLFPLLNELLPECASVAHLDIVLLEESRIRTATIMSKVFLHHLTPLIELGTAFNELWVDILDYIERFMKVGSDLLSEQMQEILKNMLLVMHSVRVFHNDDGTLQLPRWELTWKRIGEFLPNIKEELFHDEDKRGQVMSVTNAAASPQPPPIPPAESITSPNDISPIKSTELLKTYAQPVLLPPTPLVLPVDKRSANAPNGITEVAYTQRPNSAELLTSAQRHTLEATSPRHSLAASPITTNPLLLLGDTPMLVRPVPSIVAKPISESAAESASVGPPLETSPVSLPAPSASATISSPASLPDLVNDTPLLSDIQATVSQTQDLSPTHLSLNQQSVIENNSLQNNIYSSCSFSIELPETPPAAASANVEPSQQQNHEPQLQLHHQYADYAVASTATPQQQHQQQLLLQQQQQHSLYNQHSLGGHKSASALVADEAELTPQQQHVQQQQHQQQQPADAKAVDNVPMNTQHTFFASGQYLAMQQQNPAIIQNFSAPPTLQYSALQQQSGETDIYQEYITNPYNLATATGRAEVMNQPAMTNVFASPASYFNASVDPSSIPPGSEMLYGQP